MIVLTPWVMMGSLYSSCTHCRSLLVVGLGSSSPTPGLSVWSEAARHFDEQGLAALILWIATTNLFNRLNVATGQVAGAWG